MACIITYENKQYTQKEFEQYFKEHFTEFIGEFINSTSALKTSLGKELEYKDPYVPTGSLKNFKKYQVLDEKNNDIGSVVIEYRGKDTVILHPKLNVTGKGYGKDLYKLISSKFNVDIQEWNEGAIANSNAAKKMWDSLEKEGVAKRIIDEEQGDNFRFLRYKKAGSKQDIQGFKQFIEDNKETPVYKTQISNDNIFSKQLINSINTKFGRNLIRNTESGYKVQSLSDVPIIEKEIDEFEEQFGYRPLSLNGRDVILNYNYRQKKGDTEINQEVFDLLGTDPKSNAVIQSVLDSNILPEEDIEMANMLLESNIPIELIEDSELEGDAYMFTNGESIFVGNDSVGSESTLKFAQSILHETLHTRTVEALVNPKNDQDILFKRQMEYHYNRLKRADKKNTYGFSSVEEFVAEIGSNKAFRDYVDNLVAGDNFIDKFVNFVRKLFNGKDSVQINNSIKKYLNVTVSEKKKFSSKKNYYTVSDTTKDVLDKLLKSSANRIKALEAKIIKGSAGKKQDLVDQENKTLDEMMLSHRNKVYIAGILIYCKNMESHFDSLDSGIDKLKKDAEDGDFNKVVASAETIRSLGNFAYAYSNTTSEIIKSLREIKKANPDYESEIAEVERIVSKVSLKTTQLKEDYIGLSRIIFAKFLVPVGFNKSLDQIEKLLREPVRDISFISRHVRNLQDSGDDILGMIDVTIKQYDDDANNEILEFKRVMIDMAKMLEKAGIKGSNFMIKKDSTGKNSHYFITERDILDYRNKIAEFAKKLSDPEKSNDPERARMDNLNEWSKFYSENGVNSQYSKEAYNKLIEAKKKELGSNFDAWFQLNAIYNPSSGHYSIPSKIDKGYTELHKNSAKSEYYWTVMNAKMKMESHYPEQLKHLRRVPQIRKDFVESMASNGFSRMKEMFGEMFKTKEDDTEVGHDLGIRDEKNNIIHFIPVYFNTKIKDTRDLSEDITSSMIMYGNMSIKRGKLSTIVDMLEIGKDVIKERGVIATSNKGNLLKTINKVRGLTFEEEIVEPTPGKIYERLEDFYKMNIYGQTRVEGKVIPEAIPIIGGMDSERVIDLIGRYAGLRTLALNMTAAANSVNVGSMLTAMEAISKSVFDVKSLAFAESKYWGNVIGVLGDVGSRMPSSKLALWAEHMDTMNDFKEQIYGTEGEIKTKVGQLMMASPLFMASKMNEHYLHNKVSLSVAHTFRYSPKDGKFVFKDEYFKQLRDLKEQQRVEISELKGKVTSSQVNAIKSKYSERLNSMESELNESWDKMTNFWDAHEAVNGKLELKKEFSDHKARLVFIGRQRAMNNSIQGMYGQLDKGTMNMYALGRLGMMYRKWILPAMDRRFGSKMTDYEARLEKEGYYLATGRFMKGLYNDIKENNLSIVKSWNVLTDAERSSVIRSATDIAFLLGISLLTFALTSMKGDDDDDDWFLDTAMYLTSRSFSEIGALTPTPLMAQEGFKIIKTPLGGSESIQALANSLNVFHWGEENKTGKFKGMYNWQKNIIRVVPPANTVYGIFFPEEKLRAYSN